MKDYPSVRYALNETPRIVASAEDDAELGPQWLDTYDPEALAAAAEAGETPADPAPADSPKNKGGRPRKGVAAPAAE